MLSNVQLVGIINVNYHVDVRKLALSRTIVNLKTNFFPIPYQNANTVYYFKKDRYLMVLSDGGRSCNLALNL